MTERPTPVTKLPLKERLTLLGNATRDGAPPAVASVSNLLVPEIKIVKPQGK